MLAGGAERAKSWTQGSGAKVTLRGGPGGGPMRDLRVCWPVLGHSTIYFLISRLRAHPGPGRISRRPVARQVEENMKSNITFQEKIAGCDNSKINCNFVDRPENLAWIEVFRLLI